MPKNLPALRRADCGHGYISISIKPSGYDFARGNDLFLCAECKAALKRPKIERKA